MRSTGHSWMQALSLTSMRGSAITYVMGGPISSATRPQRRARLRAAGIFRWLGGLLAADVRHLHPPRHLVLADGLQRAQLGGAVGAPGPDRGDLPAQRTAQVVPGPGEQAGVELALGREPGAGAAAAERLGDRGDHADLTGAVAVAVAAGDLPVVGRRDRLKRPLAADQGDDLGGGDDLLQPPAVGRADVHVLDEPQHVPAVPEVPGHRQDRLLVLAAPD